MKRDEEKAREIIREHLHGVNSDDEILLPFRQAIVSALSSARRDGSEKAMDYVDKYIYKLRERDIEAIRKAQGEEESR